MEPGVEGRGLKIHGEPGKEDGGKETERGREGSWFFRLLDRARSRLGSARLGSPESLFAAAPRQFVEIRSDSFYVCHAATRYHAYTMPLPIVLLRISVPAVAAVSSTIRLETSRGRVKIRSSLFRW